VDFAIACTRFGDLDMTATEEKLIEIGNALSLSLGHKMGICPKGSQAVPCTCGAGTKQSQALSAWLRLVDSIRES
jgi:hypothetical protein